MNKEISFKVILLSIQDRSAEFQAAVASLIANSFNLEEKEVVKIFESLPVILFENLTANDLKIVKDHLIFLSKLGLDFNITPKSVPGIPKAGLVPKTFFPIISCPSCGETFCLMRSQDIQRHVSQGEKKVVRPDEVPSPGTVLEQKAQKSAKALAPKLPLMASGEAKQERKRPSNQQDFGMPAEFDEVEVLSAELQSIVEMEKDGKYEEIEEVGSISEEIEEIGSISEEIEEIGPASDEVQTSNIPRKSPSEENGFSALGGISAEFEEIEGVSAEFERVSLDDMDNDIGSLSAELEEIEGISAELENVEMEEGIEKVGEISEPFHKISISESRVAFGAGTGKTAPKKQSTEKNSDDIELEELEGISQELQGIAENIEGRKASPAKKAQKFAQGSAPTTNPVPDSPKVPPVGKAFQMEPGNCKVMIDFAGKGNIKGGTQLLAKLRGISPMEATQMAEKHAAIIVASNVSRASAEQILKMFQQYKMQGRIG